MANKSIGLLNIVFGADLRGFDRAMKKAQRSIAKFSKKMNAVGNELTTKVTLPVLGLGAAAVKMAADFEETDSKFKTVFSSIQKEAEETADVFKKSFGLSEKAAKQLLSDTGDLLVGFGFTEKAALELSQQVNELAVDLASFTNFSGGAEGASLALTKALLGERESIKSLGIAITEADLKTFAEEQGLVFKEMDRVGKATLTYQLALKQSSKAVGDFTRTSGSLTNQTRQLNFELQDLAIEFGTILIPLVKSMVEALRELTAFMNTLSTETKEQILKWAGYAAVLGPIAKLIAMLASGFRLILPMLAKVTTAVVGMLGPWGRLAAILTTVGTAIFKLIKGKKEEVKTSEDVINTEEKVNKIFEEQEKNIKNITKELPKATKAVKQYSDAMADNIIETDFTFGMSPAEDQFKDIVQFTPQLTKKQKELNAAVMLFGDVMANSMMNAANSQESFFKSFIDNIKRAIKQLLIQLSVATAINLMMGGKGTTLASAFDAAKTSLLGLANGGLATGPTMALVGEGSGTSISNPEVIAPLDKLKNYMGGDLRVTGRLVGNDIFLSNDKAGVSRNRFV
tara:strand:+ start:4788 stop:6497 length:1710 start_codon:yes stop_codon:yes gene_type:complete